MPITAAVPQAPKKRRRTDEDLDDDIIEISVPVKRARSSWNEGFTSLFAKVSQWFNVTRGKSYSPSKFFHTSSESNSAAEAIAHGGQYLEEASTDKFMPKRSLPNGGSASSLQSSSNQIYQSNLQKGNDSKVNPQLNGSGPRYLKQLNGGTAQHPPTSQPSHPFGPASRSPQSYSTKENFPSHTSLYSDPQTSVPVNPTSNQPLVGRSNIGPCSRVDGFQHSIASNTTSSNKISSLHDSYCTASLWKKSDRSTTSIYSKSFSKLDQIHLYRSGMKKSDSASTSSCFNLEEKAKYSQMLEHVVGIQSTKTQCQASSATGTSFRPKRRSLVEKTKEVWRPPRPLSEAATRLVKEGCLKPGITLPVVNGRIDTLSSTNLSASTSQKAAKSRTVPHEVSEPRARSAVMEKAENLFRRLERIQEKQGERKTLHERAKREEEKLKNYERLREENDAQLMKLVEQRLHISPKVILPDLPPEEKVDEFPDLSQEANMIVDKTWGPGPDQILSDAFRIKIKKSDLATLKRIDWLNDEVINFYFNLLMDRGKQNDLPSVYAFNTFFYQKIMTVGHSGVRRWTKQVDIFSKDLILIPVHLGMHWTLACIDMRQQSISYYDSMGNCNDRLLFALKKYLEDESMDKKKTPFDTSDWLLENCTDCPQQMNGGDCGVFACKFAEYLCRDAPFTFSQEHMPYFRRRMVYEIISKKLM